MARVKQKSRKEKAGARPKRYFAGQKRGTVLYSGPRRGGWISKFGAKIDKRTFTELNKLPRHKLKGVR